MTWWFQLAVIGGGGALGAIARFQVVSVCVRLFGMRFPWGTLFVNVLGCFIIGFLVEYCFKRLMFDDEWRFFLIVGFLGAFTTFSSFSIETLNLYQSGQPLKALSNAVFTTLSCLLMVGLGSWCGKIIQ